MKNAIINAKERIGDSKPFDLNDVTLKDAGINENVIKNKIKKANALEKYGEECFNKLNAIDNQIYHANKNCDTEKVEQLKNKKMISSRGKLNQEKKLS